MLKNAEEEGIAWGVVPPVYSDVAQSRLDLKGVQVLVGEARFDHRDENQTDG